MSETIGEAALSVYRGVGRALGPALRLMLDIRTRAGKEDPRRRHERFGRARASRPAGPLVWVHAASVGETMSVLPLVARLVGTGVTVLMTTGTVTSAAIAAERLPPGAIHQYVPLDVITHVAAFLDHWRPGVALFVESEIWPVTIAELKRRGISQVLINARLSERSFRRWHRIAGVARVLFGRLTLALAQGAGDAERLAAIGVPRVMVTGNLKFDGPPLIADQTERARLSAVIGRRPTWLAASTHPGEEAVAAEVHLALRDRLPGLLTIIAPRHPTRGADLRADLAEQGLRVASRSLGERPGPRTDVYLADTIGEMGLVYALAPIAFVGGSIAPRGGQNPIEPARLGVAVLHGPSTHNFAEIYRDLDAGGGAVTVSGAGDLAEAIVRLSADPVSLADQIAAAGAVVDRSTGALERTMAALAPLLTAPDTASPPTTGRIGMDR